MTRPPGAVADVRRRLRPVASSLTSRGWGLIVAAPVIVIAAHTVGIGELYALGCAALALVAYALAWVWTRQWRIEVVRRLQPGRVEAGHSALVLLTLHNRSTTRSPVLTLRDPFDGRTTQLVVAPIPARQRISASYRLPAAGRGVYRLGPLSLEATDPLGLARRARSSATTSTFIVHPRVEALRSPELGGGADRSRGAALPVPGRDNDEFASLREYQPGDDIRRMHWASTARTDTLMLREDQLERRGNFCVLLDTYHESWSGGDFERAVSVAASIGVGALDAGLQTRLLTTDGTDSGPGAGRSRRSELLDLLAAATTHAGGPGQAADRRGRTPTASSVAPGGTVVIVGSERTDADALRRTAGIGRRTDVIVVIVEGSAGPDARRSTPHATTGTGRAVRVAPGATLASAWDRIR